MYGTRVANCSFVAIFLTLLLLPQACFAVRHIRITSCPYTANVAGAVYTVAQNMDGHGNCIDIAAPRVTLNVNGKIVSGGIGIYVESAAKDAHLFGPGTVWGGITDKGDFAVIKGLSLEGDVGYGLLILGAKGTVAQGNDINGAVGVDLRASEKCTIDHNKIRAWSGGEYSPAYDIWIDAAAAKGQSKNNVITNNNVNSNGALDGASGGILVGDSFDSSGNCAPGQFPVEGTIIENNQANMHSGWGVPGFGISLGCQNDSAHSIVKHNVAKNNGALYAPAFDAYDGNSKCGSNKWEDDTFKVTNQTCVK